MHFFGSTTTAPELAQMRDDLRDFVWLATAEITIGLVDSIDSNPTLLATLAVRHR